MVYETFMSFVGLDPVILHKPLKRYARIYILARKEMREHEIGINTKNS